MIILGIDPGYGRLGYAVLRKEQGREKLIEASCLETRAAENRFKRITELSEKLEKIISKHQPDILAVEKVFFTKNQKTALEVAEIKGIVIYLGLKNKMAITEYTPLEVKSAVCGYGKADKNQVKKMVKILLNLNKEPGSDDTADAIALCLTYSARNPQGFTKI